MKQKYIFFIVFILLIAIPATAYFFFFQKNTEPETANISDAAIESLAKCLADKQITMYGADWCVRCQEEKNAFGKAFKYVPYVECPDEPQACLEVDIESYPTWVFPNGRKLVGKQGILKLAEESNCPLPINK